MGLHERALAFAWTRNEQERAMFSLLGPDGLLLCLYTSASHGRT